MKITTSVTFEICDEIGEYREISRTSYEHNGPVALAKKGRDQMQKNMQFQQNQAQINANNAAGYNSDVQSLLSELIGSTTPGSMSPAASAAYAADTERLQNTYNGLRTQLFASAARRGFGNAPSGFQTSSINELNAGQQQAQTDAYRTGIERTAQQRSQALSGALNATGLSNNAEINNTNASSNSAFERSRMGSGLGDALAAAGSILGGLTGMGGLVGSFGKLFGGGGGGSYMPNDNVGQPTGNLPLPKSGIGSY